jgi:hypothetical protein
LEGVGESEEGSLGDPEGKFESRREEEELESPGEAE